MPMRSRLREHRAGLAEHAQTDAADRIGQPVGVALALEADGQLNGNQQKEDRGGKDDDLAGAHGGHQKCPLIVSLIRSARLWHQP